MHSVLFYCYDEVCKSIEESMRKTMLWKSGVKPSLPGSPCHCHCYVIAPRVAAVDIAMALLPQDWKRPE